MYGPFHRINDSPETVKKIIESGELWGQSPRNIGASNFPKVKAYEGKLPAGRIGIEFETEVEPDEATPPGQPMWSMESGHPGVQRIEVVVEGRLEEYVKIKVRLLRQTVIV
jgi:hypothetical protein